MVFLWEKSLRSLRGEALVFLWKKLLRCLCERVTLAFFMEGVLGFLRGTALVILWEKSLRTNPGHSWEESLRRLSEWRHPGFSLGEVA